MEKRYNAREVALEVLKKAEELLKSSKVLEKYEALNSKKAGYKPSMADKEKRAEASDSKLEVEPGKSKNQARIERQVDPNKNPDEKKENSNPAPGAYPQNTEKYLMEKGELEDGENEIGTKFAKGKKLAKFLEGVYSKRIK